ncbi:unnamed protein product, partial [Prorocentrum cordatum]
LRMSPLFSAADGGDREGSASRPAGSRRTWGRARGAALSETKNKHGAERTGPPLWGTAWGAGPQRGERGGPRRRSLCDSARRHTGGTRAISAASVRRGQHEEVLEEEEERRRRRRRASTPGAGVALDRPSIGPPSVPKHERRLTNYEYSFGAGTRSTYPYRSARLYAGRPRVTPR